MRCAALAVRGQMHHDDAGATQVSRDGVKKLLQRFDAAGGCANADNRDSARRAVLSLPQLILPLVDAKRAVSTQ
jgi:hypothetical protein